MNLRLSIRFAVTRVVLCVCVSLLCGHVPGAPAESRQDMVREYVNPVDVPVADPCVLKDEGKYYAYGTWRPWIGFDVFTSDDMVHWRLHGLCYEKQENSWGRDHYWAPEVIRKGSRYYLFFSAYSPSAGRRSLCVAVADSPLGPFKDLKVPLFEDPRGFIDAHPFYDAAGKRHYVYMCDESCWPAKIWVAELKDSMDDLATTITECFAATEPWEHNWVEAPFIIPHKDHYYMMYSVCSYASPYYAIGYAVSKTPVGPWVKPENNPVIRKSADVSGPGHNGVVASPDGRELYAVYHRHFSFAGGGAREMAIDRIVFAPSRGGPDLLTVPGAPSQSRRPFPSGAKPWPVGASDEFNGTGLDLSRWLIFNENAQKWRLDNGWLAIDATDGDIHEAASGAANLFMQYAPKGDFTIEARVAAAPKANFEQAVLLVWQDISNYIKLGTLYGDGPKLELGWESDGIYDTRSCENTHGETLFLRIEKKGREYRGYASSDGVNWEPVGQPVRMKIEQPLIGLGAMAPGSRGPCTVKFDWFRVHRKSLAGSAAAEQKP